MQFPATRASAHILKNGLTVILDADSTAPVISTQAWVETGSIHEGQFLGAGISHMLEHMVFKGTENYDGKDIILNEEQNIILSPDYFDDLLLYKGQTLITTVSVPLNEFPSNTILSYGNGTHWELFPPPELIQCKVSDHIPVPFFQRISLEVSEILQFWLLPLSTE